MKTKQIIIDKDAFVGINLDKLCNFAKNHLMLGCDTLFYECATTSVSKRKDMISRYKRIIKAGAYYCSCSIAYLQSEASSSNPFPWFLPDLAATEQIRTGKARLEEVIDSSTTEEIFESRCNVARKVFVGLSDKLKKRINEENPAVGKKIKELPSDRFERLRKLFERIDAKSLHQVCVDSIPNDWIKNRAQYCLSPEWMSWQNFRLTNATVMNYHYLHQKGGGPGDKTAEHDYQDMEYVLLLSRADALLTKDKGCSSLAQAAFPEKDVFSSLDEVPDEYLCNWS